ncbi:F0F1 ATP synthase subunit B [Candidatus Pelagibacter sp. Uisw_121]|uniref:F0F1 ATP synthase subunit B family protein n=1 Tax=Candidatus Pelagibacter sp. Uisw_121 TaxID=3230987 RepID=UPI0039ED245B
MIKKIFFQSIFLSFLFFMEAFAAESGGMPQLNPEFWVSQIFWLIITFGILYVVLSKLILPKISANLETRKSQILENIEAAEKKREESEQRIEEYEKIVQDSKNEAKNYFKQAREKVLKDIGIKKEALDKEIDEEVNKAEIEIKSFRDNAPEKIKKIAEETSSDLLQELIGAEVNSSSISAIVEDLSRKKNG